MKIQEQSNQALKQLIASGSIEFSKLSSLANICLSDALLKASYDKKIKHYNNLLTFSPKVFIPLTFLCRDVCHYCTFAQTPKKVESPYLSIDQVISIAKEGEDHGCY